ncbi:hypothetical protein Bca52824_040823 [Brassica carinata]|uniref:Uncharacterized protein n=1 Tax=Brassica carinata TaxID=52824 RepID=A0A8X7RS00_BRACI|nr:hypothetical protein Bca52824_040823 [Brassica carinata]
MRLKLVKPLYYFFTEYSIQDIVDFTNPEERSWLKKDTKHYCYPWYIHLGIEYVKRFAVQREEDRPFQVDCCTKNVAPRLHVIPYQNLVT